MLRRVQGQLLSRNVEKDAHNVVGGGDDDEVVLGDDVVVVGDDDDDRAPQFVESCDTRSENMDQNKRTWKRCETWSRSSILQLRNSPVLPQRHSTSPRKEAKDSLFPPATLFTLFWEGGK